MIQTEREPNTQYVLSLSYGKDSIACLGAIDKLGLPLDRIVHSEVWATQDIPADLPPMVEFKAKADEWILQNYGIRVEHICAMKKPKYSQSVNVERESQSLSQTETATHESPTQTCSTTETNAENSSERFEDSQCREDLGAKNSNTREKLTYEDIFYRPLTPRSRAYQKWMSSQIGNVERERELRGSQRTSADTATANSSRQLYTGFPYTPTRAGGGGWCHELKHILADKNLRISNQSGELVYEQSQTTVFSGKRLGRAADINIVQYLGIAADESERIKRHTKPGYALPLVEAGWDEAYCRAWCEERGMLSPIYTTAARGGCWFCHNQSVEQLRLLRRNYPDLWKILLTWDKDSPVSFKADGHTVHDFDRRFAAEDAGRINPNDKRFRWAMLDEPEQMRMI